MAHEQEHLSEDLDFQPESPKSQHFKVMGPILPWILAGSLFFVFHCIELMYQHYPDEYLFRKPHTPRLDEPDRIVQPDK